MPALRGSPGTRWHWLPLPAVGSSQPRVPLRRGSDPAAALPEEEGRRPEVLIRNTRINAGCLLTWPVLMFIGALPPGVARTHFPPSLVFGGTVLFVTSCPRSRERHNMRMSLRMFCVMHSKYSHTHVLHLVCTCTRRHPCNDRAAGVPPHFTRHSITCGHSVTTRPLARPTAVSGSEQVHVHTWHKRHAARLSDNRERKQTDRGTRMVSVQIEGHTW